MLRSTLLYLSQAAWAQNLMVRWRLTRRAAARFVAGERVEDALQVVHELNTRCINATLDHIGEHVTTPEGAHRAAEAIHDLFEAIQRSGVRANVSIKLTQMGMGLDDVLCAELLERIAGHARGHDQFVRIDMEDSPWVDRTVAHFERLMERGFTRETVGLVIQSCLRRAEADVTRWLEAGTRIRLVKGAYREPASVAFPRKAEVDAQFDRLTARLLDASRARSSLLSADGRRPPIPAIATHDERRIDFARQYAHRIGLPKAGLEFQMLHGIRRDLQERLAGEGWPVRVYVPYGTHWYPYFMRRLAERPANLWFLLSNLARR